MNNRVNLEESKRRSDGDPTEVSTATAMALIDIAESLRLIYDSMPSRFNG